MLTRGTWPLVLTSDPWLLSHTVFFIATKALVYVSFIGLPQPWVCLRKTTVRSYKSTFFWCGIYSKCLQMVKSQLDNAEIWIKREVPVFSFSEMLPSVSSNVGPVWQAMSLTIFQYFNWRWEIFYWQQPGQPMDKSFIVNWFGANLYSWAITIYHISYIVEAS